VVVLVLYSFFVSIMIYSSYAYHHCCHQLWIPYVAPIYHYGKRNVDEMRIVDVRKSGGVPTFHLPPSRSQPLMKRQSIYYCVHFLHTSLLSMAVQHSHIYLPQQ